MLFERAVPQYASKQCTAATAVEDPKFSTAIANFDKCPSAVVLEQQLSESKLADTPLQKRTQVRFWIPVQIPIDYDYMMPRLPENQKVKIPQVGSLTKKCQK